MRTTVLRTTISQLSRTTSYRTVHGSIRTARRLQRVQWRRTLCVELARPLDILATGDDAEDNIPVFYGEFEDEDGT